MVMVASVSRRDLPEHVGPVTQQLPDPVDAVRAFGHRRRQIGEYLPGRMCSAHDRYRPTPW